MGKRENGETTLDEQVSKTVAKNHSKAKLATLVVVIIIVAAFLWTLRSLQGAAMSSILKKALSWQTIAVACGLLYTICNVLDKIPRVATRRKIHDRLIALWFALDETPLLKMPQLMAQKTLQFVHKAFGSKPLSWISICTSIVFSIYLTSTALLVAMGIRDGRDVGTIIAQCVLWSLPMVLKGDATTVLSIYGINLVFDVATILVTIQLLRWISTAKTAFGLTFIVVDVLLAVLLAYLAYAFLICAGYAAGHYPNEAVLGLISSPDLLVDWTLPLWASTTLLPTVTYMSILLAMYLGQAVVKLVMTYAERVAENDPRDSWAFRILGMVVAMIGAFAIAIQHFLG